MFKMDLEKSTMLMNDSVLVNQVYLIFNRPQFLVDSSGKQTEYSRKIKQNLEQK